jgi:hypothetical protein
MAQLSGEWKKVQPVAGLFLKDKRLAEPENSATLPSPVLGPAKVTGRGAAW